MANTNNHLLDEYQKLETKKNRLIEYFGKNADVADIVAQQEEIIIKGVELQREGLPDHEYNSVKTVHEQLQKDIDQDTRDYSELVGVGMAEIMQGISQIEATEQERVEYVNKGLAKAIVGCSLTLGSILIILAALFIPSLAAVVLGSAAVSTPVLLAIGFVGIALLPGEGYDPKEHSTVDRDVAALSTKAMTFMSKSIETVTSLENMRSSERGI